MAKKKTSKRKTNHATKKPSPTPISDTLLALLEIILNTCVDKAPKKLSWDRGNMQVPYMFSLYSIVVELAGDSYQAVRSHKELASHVLTRALLEAVVDLFNVIRNSDYVNIRFQRALTERKKKLKYLLTKEPDLLDMTKHTPEYVEEVLGKIEKLRNPEVVTPNIKKRFEDAGMEGYYDTAYAYLCDYSHHDASTIINRPPGSTAYCMDEGGIQMLANLIADIIFKASIAVHEFPKTGQANVFEDLQQKGPPPQNTH